MGDYRTFIVAKVMTEIGFKNADLQAMERWEEMVKALKVAAGVVVTLGL